VERVRSLPSFQVLCLQEVQENHYWEQLEPTFKEMGMSCFVCLYLQLMGLAKQCFLLHVFKALGLERALPVCQVAAGPTSELSDWPFCPFFCN